MWVFVNGLKVFQNYTLLQWAWFFMFYCIFGWCFESTYCSLKSMRLMNRGFCHGPWLPIYGAGGTLFLIFAWPYRANLITTFLMGMLVGTTLELITGPLMYHIFHMKWWDYSQNPLNFRGYICLGASLGWGAMALFFVHFLHPRVAELTVDWTPIGYIVVVTMLYTLFVEDVIFSVLGALDIRKRLETLAANSEEIQQLKQSISEAREHLEELQEAARANASEVKIVAESEGRLAAAKLVSEEAARALQDARETGASAARSLAESGVQAARAAVDSGVQTARSAAQTVADTGAQAVQTARSAAQTVADTGAQAVQTARSAAQTVADTGAQAVQTARSAAQTVADTGAQAVQTARSAAQTVADTGAQAVRTVAETGRGAADLGKSAVQRSLELRRRLAEERRRRLEERLAILEDGGDARSGRMNWWVGNTLRNNPTMTHHPRHSADFEFYARLRASSQRHRESFEKMEARIDAEKAKDRAAEEI